MKKVIITGPTGAIGIALIKKLISENVQVTAICHKGSNRIKDIPSVESVKVVECNLDEIKNLILFLDSDYDVFFHFAWSNTVGEGRNNIDAQIRNIQYTIDAVEVAKELGCKKFIGAGSQAEYGRQNTNLNSMTPTNPENGYGMAKLCAGNMSRIRCNQLGIEHIWTRILSVYGPYDGENTLIISLIKQLLNGEVPHCTKGEQIWDYCYSKDVANAFWLLGATKKCLADNIYCIGSGCGQLLSSYINCIKDCINPNMSIGFGDIPYSDKQVMHLCADTSEIQSDVGFLVQTSFQEGVQETIQWVKNRMKK